jgi:DNA-directed RNA polymerase subunit RPC12/RpoP
MIQKKIDTKNIEEAKQENLDNLDELLAVRCKYCGKKIDLRHCSFDAYESPICFGGCRG